MKEFVLLMYDDASDTAIASDGNRWGEYVSRLRSSGLFDGGSTIGPGMRARKGHPDAAAPPELGGFIRVRAENLAAAREFLAGNPTYEGGGTVDIRELPDDGA